MLRSILTAWRPVALAVALLALVAAPAGVQAAGHSSGFHSGGFHAGSYHAGGMHYGGYHAGASQYGGYHPGYYSGGYRPSYYSGYHNSYGYDHRNGYDYGRRNYGYYGGYYSPWLYGSGAYSNGNYLPPDFYYSPNYTTAAPDNGVSAYYTPDATTPAPDVTAPAAPESTSGLATVDVHVPASAQIWFNDSLTKQTGNERQFVSPPLTPGKDYTYDIRARWTDNGHVTDETRTITVHANDVTSVDFTQPAPAAAASK